MSQFAADTPQTEEVVHTYAPGQVVQMRNGHPHMAGAEVAALAPAVIRITTTRVSALVDGNDWSWYFDDIEDVAHAVDATWTIMVVPGVDDYGVAPKPEDVLAFRRDFDRALGEFRARTVVDTEPEPEPVHDVAPPPLWPEPAFDPAPVLAVEPQPQAPPTVTVTLEPEPTPAPRHTDGLATLEARSISAWFGTHNVLDRVSLVMPAGRVTALIGPSGCGKSTFLRVLNRMHEMIPSASLAGEVRLDGEDIYDVSRKLTDARRQIGMVFQKPNPFPAMSIYDNVVAGFRLTGTRVNNSEKDDVVEGCLTKAGLWVEVRDRLRSPGGGLSGGQQQRLCIARSLAIQPRVLLMDEPCSALDPTSTRRIEETIVELKSEVTIVIVTHNMQQANRVSDQCAFFLAEAGQPGVIVEFGATGAMFNAPQDDRTNAYVNGRFG